MNKAKPKATTTKATSVKDTRCKETKELEVHHKRRGGGNKLTNAEVLCQDCHSKTSSYGEPGKSPEPFNKETKEKALKKAGNRCQGTNKKK